MYRAISANTEVVRKFRKIKMESYCKDSKFWDRKALANSTDPDQTAQTSLITCIMVHLHTVPFPIDLMVKTISCATLPENPGSGFFFLFFLSHFSASSAPTSSNFTLS